MTSASPRTALLSVSDKTGLVDFARGLAELGFRLVSTGGTARALREAGLAVVEVAELTGRAEILDGRVKTLHPAVHAGLLARTDLPEHRSALEEAGFGSIEVLAVNLYPFERTLAAGASFDDALEQVDVGGPAMTRAAAKNHEHVLVLSDPADYGRALDALRAGDVPLSLRRGLAAKAFARTAAYDAAIAGWLERSNEPERVLPRTLRLQGSLAQDLRYGENPHQQGALYALEGGGEGVVGASQLQGKPLSYNNLLDADAAWQAVRGLKGSGCVIVKHASPCGGATASALADAYRAALACDPLSAFGGIVALGRPLDAETAGEVARLFAEVVLAPEVSDEAREILSAKKNLRVLAVPGGGDGAPALNIRALGGGLLVQEPDRGTIDLANAECPTDREPTPEELASLAFAWAMVKFVRSNAIVLATGTRTIGIGGGQTSRVDAVAQAVERAKSAERPAGPWVMASDAFFPFKDGLERAIEAGVAAVVQPGGSVRDAEVVEAANRAGVAMLFTKMRHFRH